MKKKVGRPPTGATKKIISIGLSQSVLDAIARIISETGESRGRLIERLVEQEMKRKKFMDTNKIKNLIAALRDDPTEDLIEEATEALDPHHQGECWPDPVEWDGRPLREQADDMIVLLEENPLY